MGNYLTSASTPEKHVWVKPATRSTNDGGGHSIKLQDLPEDLLATILSKLPAEEVVRTSVLSSEWRWMWTACPKLHFNGVDDACRNGGNQNSQMFIDGVNAVLQKHRGKFVDNLEIKFIAENKQVYHINNWIRFAISSRTRKLAFDLASPPNGQGHRDHYRFPFELLDKESVCCLQCLQLSFVCLKPPSQFIGLPNLRKLELYLVKTTRRDLENMLCSCCKLERLSLVRCHLNDELRVTQPLSHLQYLQVICCRLTKIEFHAANISTFVYDGSCIPFSLHHASKLENAKISFTGAILQHVAESLLDGLPNVQNLTLQLALWWLETRWMLNIPRMFSQLRHLQLRLLIPIGETDKILYLLVSLMRVVPLIEKLEVHFHGISTLWFANYGPLRQEIPPCDYAHLKSIHVTAFRAARSQVEFLLHVLENAPAVQVVTLDTAQRLTDARNPDEIDPTQSSVAFDVVRGPLLEKLPSHAKLFLV